MGAVLRSPVVAVVVPVARGDRVDAVLSAPVDPGRLSGLLASQGMRGGAFATLTDAKGMVVARSHEAAASLGRPVPNGSPRRSAEVHALVDVDLVEVHLETPARSGTAREQRLALRRS